MNQSRELKTLLKAFQNLLNKKGGFYKPPALTIKDHHYKVMY